MLPARATFHAMPQQLPRKVDSPMAARNSALTKTSPGELLAHFDAARAALEKASRIDEVKAIRDQAAAFSLSLRQSRQSLEMQNRCAEIKLRAERRLGDLLHERIDHQGGRKAKRSHDGTVSESLDDYGVNKNQSSRWQRLAEIPDAQFESYLEEVHQAGDEEITVSGLLRAAGRRHSVDVLSSSDSYEWYTPACFIDAAREVMGSIDLDPASSKKANQVVRAKEYLTLEDNGLAYHWHGNVWLNPPYGLDESGTSNQGVWSNALEDEVRAGRVAQAVLLVNAATDASWFQPLWDSPPLLHLVSHPLREPRGARPSAHARECVRLLRLARAHLRATLPGVRAGRRSQGNYQRSPVSPVHKPPVVTSQLER